MCHILVMTVARNGVSLCHTFALIAVKTAVGLWLEAVISIVMTETNVMTWVWTEVECRTIAKVVDRRTIAMWGDYQSFYLSIFHHLPFVWARYRWTVVRINGCEVSKELWWELVIPVECSIEVAPMESIFIDVFIFIAATIVVIHIVFCIQSVFTWIDTQRHTWAVVEDIGQLKVQVVEEIRHIKLFIIIVSTVHYRKGRTCQEV